MIINIWSYQLLSQSINLIGGSKKQGPSTAQNDSAVSFFENALNTCLIIPDQNEKRFVSHNNDNDMKIKI